MTTNLGRDMVTAVTTDEGRGVLRGGLEDPPLPPVQAMSATRTPLNHQAKFFWGERATLALPCLRDNRTLMQAEECDHHVGHPLARVLVVEQHLKTGVGRNVGLQAPISSRQAWERRRVHGMPHSVCGVTWS